MGSFSDGHGAFVGVCLMPGMTERGRLGAHAVGYVLIILVMAIMSFVWKWVQPVTARVLNGAILLLPRVAQSVSSTTPSLEIDPSQT